MNALYLFFLRVFNDVDHIAPVIWKMKKAGRDVRVILIDKNRNLNLDSDPRLKLLRESGCPVHYYYAIPESPFRFANRPVPNQQILKKVIVSVLNFLDWILFTKNWVHQTLKSTHPKVCIFDLQVPNPDTNEGKWIYEAKHLNIPCIALPHGMNIFTERGEGQYSTDTLKMQRLDYFDAVLEQNPEQVFQVEKYGVKKDKITVLGSARFNPEWIEMGRNIWKTFSPQKSIEPNKLKILFFLSRWDQKVKQEETLKAISALLQLDFAYLVLKEHTREGGGALPYELQAHLRSSGKGEYLEAGFSCETLQSSGSVSLVKWADVVINFSSSIGLEALGQNKLLIYPGYLHHHQTIFDLFSAGIPVSSEAELVATIKRISTGNYSIPYSPETCFRYAVYGGKPPHDVLKAHVDFLTSLGQTAYVA